MTPTEAFRANLLRLRKARQIEQQDLAKTVGIHQPKLSEFERGTTAKISLDRACAIAEALGVSLASMLREPKPEQPT
ncbi:MAG: XRE family transcriptional regulator [Proteobacteria bacterium]|nr:XRE family transcriptional regulator [Pseudomonadota bacterium]